jgi:hypothetical protein
MARENWTDEMVAFAKEKYADGFSAAQIAGMLNVNYNATFSRNAVIGKLHRSGAPKKFPGRQSFAGQPKPRKERRSSIKTVKRLNGARGPNGPQIMHSTATLAKTQEIVLTSELNSETNVDLLALEDHHCHWPVGDNIYCGAPVIAKRKSYCSIHAEASSDKTRNARKDENDARRNSQPAKRGRWF